jgi:hypothetical protein
MATLRLTTADAPALQQALRDRGVESTRLQIKSISDLQVLVVALGGGAGIAVMIQAIGSALMSYFEGRSKLESAKSVEISVGDITIKATSATIGDVLDRLRDLLSKHSS